MSHYHPCQKLCYIDQAFGSGLLLAATGPFILSLDLQNGTVISKWPYDIDQSSDHHVPGGPRNGDTLGKTMDQDHPTKRRKIDPFQEDEAADSGESSVSIEFVSERAKGQRRKKKKQNVNSALPNVSHLISTADGRNVVAVTAEDKCIRVFEIDSPGHLKLLTERHGNLVSRDGESAYYCVDNIILAGDKFGDVYALPLHPKVDPSAALPSKPQLERPEPLKPSASELTVHTKGNLEALRQQQLQKASAPKKEAPTFELQLILGHVSLLTDLTIAVDPSNERHEYIFTADRDEHIRVSRGIPQAHVINSYCPGHTDFVSRLCIVPELPQYLISGGGEPSIRVYNWLQGTTAAEIHLEDDYKELVGNGALRELPESSDKRAVTCIRALYLKGSSNQEEVLIIIVALEGTPAIFTYLFSPGSCLLKQGRRYSLDANVLDIVLVKKSGFMLVSLDNVHTPLSTKQPLSPSLPPIVRALELSVAHRDGDWQYDWLQSKPADKAGELSQHSRLIDVASRLERTLQLPDVRHEIEVEEIMKPKALYSPLGEFLYGLENLRKKPWGDGEAPQADDIAIANPEEQ